MRTRLVAAAAATLWTATIATSPATAAVDLELRPDPQTVVVGALVDIGLYAVSDDGTDQSFIGLLAVLTWDSTALELVEAINPDTHSWFIFGLLPDSDLDGLNDSLLDGDARFEAASISSATATEEGLLVTTLRFAALGDTPITTVVIKAALGDYSTTQVLQPGPVDVTGNLGSASVTIIDSANLSVSELNMPADRRAEVVVSGAIAGESTFGVTILVEIISRDGNTGTVTYTPAPPVDVVQRGDPWPGAGTFSAFDTNSDGLSETLNASVDDNGGFSCDAALSFAGPLTAFPVTASADAEGVWDVVLSTSAGDSNWECLSTTLTAATVRTVALGDGNGDGATDIGDFSEFGVCFTGSGPSDPPAYSLAPELRCVVYDFDDDGDIDEFDYATFWGIMSGPAP